MIIILKHDIYKSNENFTSLNGKSMLEFSKAFYKKVNLFFSNGKTFLK